MSNIVQHYKQTKTKHGLLTLRNTYRPISERGVRKTSYRFQSTEPGAKRKKPETGESQTETGESQTDTEDDNIEEVNTEDDNTEDDNIEEVNTVEEEDNTVETKSDYAYPTSLGYLDSHGLDLLKYGDIYWALKECLKSIGVRPDDSLINEAIRTVEISLLAETKEAEEKWVEAWRFSSSIALPETWETITDMEQEMTGIWNRVGTEYKKKKKKRKKKNKIRTFNKSFKKARDNLVGAEEEAYRRNMDGVGGDFDFDFDIDTWWKARENRIQLHGEWQALVAMSSWKGREKGNDFKPVWEPVALTELTEQNLANDFEQIQIRTWTRLVNVVLLDKKKLRIWYLEKVFTPDNVPQFVRRSYIATVKKGEDLSPGVRSQFQQKLVSELKKADLCAEDMVLSTEDMEKYLDKAVEVVDNRLYVTNFQPDVAKTDDDDDDEMNLTHQTYFPTPVDKTDAGLNCVEVECRSVEHGLYEFHHHHEGKAEEFHHDHEGNGEDSEEEGTSNDESEDDDENALSLYLLRIEHSDAGYVDTIEYPYKAKNDFVPFNDESEEDISSGDEGDDDDDFLKGDVVITEENSSGNKYAIIGKITGQKKWSVNGLMYQIQCGTIKKHYITGVWEPNATKWVSGNDLLFFESLKDFWLEKDSGKYRPGQPWNLLTGIRYIKKVYLKLEGPNAGKFVAIMKKTKKHDSFEISLEDMETEQEAMAAENEEEDTDNDDNDDNDDNFIEEDRYYDYKTGNETVKVKLNTASTQPQPYVDIPSFEDFKRKRQEDDQSQRRAEAIDGWNEKESDNSEDNAKPADDSNFDVSKEDYIERFIEDNRIADDRSEEDIRYELLNEFYAQTEFVDLVAEDGNEIWRVSLIDILPDLSLAPIDENVDENVDSDYVSGDDD